MTTTNITRWPALDNTQLARVDALQAARSVLAVPGLAGAGTVDAIDAVNVASWIIDGKDPWPLPVRRPWWRRSPRTAGSTP
jgi:hypothetical protein